MTIRGESFDLIREKQELDTLLSSITGILISHEVMREIPVVKKKVQEKLLGKKRGERFNLVREKEEIDIFLSGITMPRLPAEIIGETVTEQQPVAVQKAIVSIIPAGHVPARAETEGKGSGDEEKGVTDGIDQKRIAEAARGDEKQNILRDERPGEKESVPAGKISEEPKKEDRRIQEKTAVVKEHKKVLWGPRIRIIGLFVVFIIIAQAYLWLHPDAGHQAIEWTRTHIPLIDRVLGDQKDEQNIIINKIELINVRQRFVQNQSLGNLMIIEGSVINQADFPVTKVKVMGEIVDSKGRLIAARISYCGNILSDEALGKLQEEDIRTRSSISREDTIIPKGKMPFMIVFKWKTTDVAKVTVMPVGAEKISP